ncbi:uncharacterized protein C1orf131 homolog isoform X2 [Dreissena polymorpha]|uniref:Uncharacterized protein n=1 Tax=Dreissena polymorpha TaxID=45954 RepID=A0A9D4J6V4_DREPO|nr:uncharacterized protein C1orf131 homolog isoform X1 [Dreissena polymorpha]XP_052221217.1 uncharacterized protein C1orf131 homolog isoform X2 [Dreissena polymorpha]KAH3797763.1 hypothetical protein DPMN_151349 [Dreissena polymorpha]
MEDDQALDPSTMEHILKRLEAYGDSLVGGSSNTKKRKLDKRAKSSVLDTLKSNSSQTLVSSANSTHESISKKKRRKKKKTKEMKKIEKPDVEMCEDDTDIDMDDFDDVDNDDDDDEEENVKELPEKKVSKSVRLKNQARQMAEELGLVSFKKELHRKTVEEEKQNATIAGPEVVVFQSHKRKERKEREAKKEDVVRPRTKFTLESDEFDMKQARFEVRKYGIAGFQGDQKEEAMTALLIKLGAKPPKNKYVNYKEYQEKRKQQILDEKQKREIDRKLGFKVKKSGPEKRRRDKNDIGHLDGQVGRWKNGVQVVKKDDLKGFNKSKVKY